MTLTPTNGRRAAGRFGPLSRARIAAARRILTHVGIVRSIHYSLRFGGLILVARGTVVMLGHGSCLELGRRAALLIGFEHLTPVPAVLHLERGARMRIDGVVQLMRGTHVFAAEGALLAFGDRTYLNDRAKITCEHQITIGARCAIGWDAQILDTDVHRIVVDGTYRERTAPITIGDNVWIGASAFVLKGVTIGEGSVLAAGAVATRDVAACSLVAGNPGRLVRSDVSWSV